MPCYTTLPVQWVLDFGTRPTGGVRCNDSNQTFMFDPYRYLISARLQERVLQVNVSFRFISISADDNTGQSLLAIARPSTGKQPLHFCSTWGSDGDICRPQDSGQSGTTKSRFVRYRIKNGVPDQR